MLPRFDAINAAQIDAALCWVRTALMMGVDATGFAEKMLRRVRAP